MTIYLTIITTVLVLTQIVRVTQNHFQLKKLYKDYESEFSSVKTADLETTKEYYRLGVEYFSRKLEEMDEVAE